jgi:predicted amidophosphoribosyltransferase
MFCDYCGGVIHGESCSNCGAPLTSHALLTAHLPQESSEARYLRVQMEGAATNAEAMAWGVKHEAVRNREKAAERAQREEQRQYVLAYQNLVRS